MRSTLVRWGLGLHHTAFLGAIIYARSPYLALAAALYGLIVLLIWISLKVTARRNYELMFNVQASDQIEYINLQE